MPQAGVCQQEVQPTDAYSAPSLWLPGGGCWGSVESEARPPDQRSQAQGMTFMPLRKAVVSSSQELRFSQARSTTKGPEIALRFCAHGAGRAAARAVGSGNEHSAALLGGKELCLRQAVPPASDGARQRCWPLAGLNRKRKPSVRP